MEIENVSDRSNNISVSIGLQNVMDRYGTDQKAIRYNGNIVLVRATIMFIIFWDFLIVELLVINWFIRVASRVDERLKT